ncbi:MAG TPA: cytochrome C oxidase subunit IV family protein [Candidatus Binatia bacterium]|jgi:cytochrome c oxidase subunit 4
MKNGAHISVRAYAAVFAALLALTALTTGVAFVDLGGGLNNVAALAIAVVKAVLVILYFMHVRTSDRFTWIVVGAGFFWLLILVGGVMDDLLTRNWPGR